MGRIKNKYWKMRVSEQELKEIKDYCEKHSISMSNFIRTLAFDKIREDKEDK